MTGRISVLVHDPIVQGGAYRSDISDRLTNYSHTKNANGGCGNISATFNALPYEVDDWILNGLGRDIRVYSSNLTCCMRAFVNTITIKMGSSTITIGPLMDVCNRCTAIYQPILDPTVDPPLLGQTTETLIADVAISQTQYGIFERIINAGTIYNDDIYGYMADEIRDLYLENYQTPTTDETYSFGSPVLPEITLECLGYAAMLAVYVYNYFDSSNFIYLSDKIVDVLEADPNGIISSDFADISENLMLTIDYEAENRIALDIIGAIVALGGTGDKRWIFGVDQNLRAYYRQNPSTILYYSSIISGRLSVGYAPDIIIDPSEVEAGVWIQNPDLACGNRYALGVARDVKSRFIESVTFSWPMTLDIQGGQVKTINQRLAQLGLGGM